MSLLCVDNTGNFFLLYALPYNKFHGLVKKRKKKSSSTTFATFFLLAPIPMRKVMESDSRVDVKGELWSQ